MTMSTDEARTRWCPYAMAGAGDIKRLPELYRWLDALRTRMNFWPPFETWEKIERWWPTRSGGMLPPCNRVEGRYSNGQYPLQGAAMCVADRCMAWRWHLSPKRIAIAQALVATGGASPLEQSFAKQTPAGYCGLAGAIGLD